jgi:hypothetical protein
MTGKGSRPESALETTHWMSEMVSKMPLAKSMPLIVGVAIGLSACAGADYRPVVDMTGHTKAQYNHDLALCQYQARSVRNNGNEAKDAAIGAVGGAGGGALLGAIGGNAALGAGVGALAGLVGTAGYKEAQTENREEDVVKRCMRSKGFTIYS